MEKAVPLYFQSLPVLSLFLHGLASKAGLSQWFGMGARRVVCSVKTSGPRAKPHFLNDRELS